MSQENNPLGQPIDFTVPDWVPCELPSREPMEGRYCRLEFLNAERHARELYEANNASDGSIWTYMPYGPFDTLTEYTSWVEQTCAEQSTLFYAIIDLVTQKAVGVASYLRMDPANGVIEVGHINYAPALQRTPAGTEAMYLMMARIFDELGYRRYEWKCNNMNAASKRAAVRYGMTFEGIFRQATLSKGRNRDTAWYAIIDKDWRRAKSAFEAWLSPDNLGQDHQQQKSLGDFMANK